MVHEDEASVAVRRRYVGRPLSANQNVPFAAGLILGRRAVNVVYLYFEASFLLEGFV